MIQFEVRIFFLNGFKLNHHLEIGNFTRKKPPEFNIDIAPEKLPKQPNSGK